MGLSKVTSPEFPGWAVQWVLWPRRSPSGELPYASTTLRLVFHVEPEAVFPSAAGGDDEAPF